MKGMLRAKESLKLSAEVSAYDTADYVTTSYS